MFKLNIPKGPYWIELPAGIRARVMPMTTALRGAARAKAAALSQGFGDHVSGVMAAGVDVQSAPDIADPHVIEGMVYFLYVVSLAQVAIIEWEGVGDADGAPIPPDQDNIRDLMTLPMYCDAFVAEYSKPLAEIEAEGNASGPGSHGTAGAGPDTVPGAKKSRSRARTVN